LKALFNKFFVWDLEPSSVYFDSTDDTSDEDYVGDETIQMKS